MNLDVTPLSFGKYKGMTPEQIADQDPGYIVDLYNGHGPKRCSKTLMLACVDAIEEAGIED